MEGNYSKAVWMVNWIGTENSVDMEVEISAALAKIGKLIKDMSIGLTYCLTSA